MPSAIGFLLPLLFFSCLPFFLFSFVSSYVYFYFLVSFVFYVAQKVILFNKFQLWNFRRRPKATAIYATSGNRIILKKEIYRTISGFPDKMATMSENGRRQCKIRKIQGEKNPKLESFKVQKNAYFYFGENSGSLCRRFARETFLGNVDTRKEKLRHNTNSVFLFLHSIYTKIWQPSTSPLFTIIQCTIKALHHVTYRLILTMWSSVFC